MERVTDDNLSFVDGVRCMNNRLDARCIKITEPAGHECPGDQRLFFSTFSEIGA